jgi:DNA-damage-inducible protein J
MPKPFFTAWGCNATQAISIFYRQVELRNGLPFDVAIPTPKTRRTFDATDAGHNLVVCKDEKDMFKKFGI